VGQPDSIYWATFNRIKSLAPDGDGVGFNEWLVTNPDATPEDASKAYLAGQMPDTSEYRPETINGNGSTGWQGVNNPGRGCFDFCEEHDYCYIGDCLPAHQAKHRHISNWDLVQRVDGKRVWMGTNLLLTDEENAARDAYEAERDALLVADPPC
jgi:hypothetical protein